MADRTVQNNSKFHCTSSETAEVGSSNKPGCPLSWPCSKPANVRELLGLGPPYYFGTSPVIVLCQYQRELRPDGAPYHSPIPMRSKSAKQNEAPR